MRSAADLDMPELGRVLDGHRPQLSLAAVGVFPGPEGVLFLGAVVTPDLLALDEAVHRSVAPRAQEL